MALIKLSRIFTILNLSRQAFGQYKFKIITITLLGFLSGILEGIGVNALIPLLSFFVGGEQGTDPISKFLKSAFNYFNVDFSLKQILIFISLMFIIKAVVLIICDYINIKISTEYEEKTRSQLLEKNLRANWPYLLNQKLGFLETVIVTNVRSSTVLFRQISMFIMILTSLLMYIVIAINISLIITLVTLALGGILFLFFKPLISQTRAIGRKSEELTKIIANFINENIIGAKTVKALNVAEPIIGLGKKYFKNFKELQIRAFLLKDVTGYLLQPISLVFICAVFAFAYKAPNFNLAALIAVIYLIQRIFQYIQQLQAVLHEVNGSAPYLKNVLSYQAEAESNLEPDGGSEEFAFNRAFEFNRVNFSYGSGRKILNDISFKINKGEFVGLIGPSGAGKTTLVDLILRLLNLENGQITLDGVNINEISLKNWREKIGYVSQDIYLMNDTIANNIKFYDDSISDEAVAAAAKLANIYDAVTALPEKFDTVIGDRGVKLSGGERQRVIIARILARRPEFLIFDEATSSLDNESELKIQKVIENLKGKVTVLAIAHRLTTIQNSDKLLVLEKGKIIERGAPAELLKDEESYFYKTYNLRS